MNDRVTGLLELYDIEAVRVRKGRGALLCDTDNGCFIFKEYNGSEQKADLQARVLKKLADEGVSCERIFPTKEGALFCQDTDGRKYMLKSYFDNRECNIRDSQECREAASMLSRLHRLMVLPPGEAGDLSVYSLTREYEKHNRELKKVWQYLCKKGQKSAFEVTLLARYPYFLNQALEVSGEWKEFALDSDTEYIKEKGFLCHGDYQQHNIIRENREFAVINFEKLVMDNPVRDICLYLRKVMEKNNWSVELGESILHAYDVGNPLPARSFVELYYRLAYPVKFWKIVNFYYNARKVWTPDKNIEKLNILMEQEQQKQNFLDKVFRDVAHLR